MMGQAIAAHRRTARQKQGDQPKSNILEISTGDDCAEKCVSPRMLYPKCLPVLATIPRSGTWLLRYTISFLCHLDRGGRIDDRITGEIFGEPTGEPFNFQRFRGGPLFWVNGTLPDNYLFIGHTACPGFAGIADRFSWWSHTSFHARGHDYLHEDFDHRYTPVDLADHSYASLPVEGLDRLARSRRGLPTALVFRNPLDHALSYFRFCQGYDNPANNSVQGVPLAKLGFRKFLFAYGLPSYAKQFISYQAMAERRPDKVRLVPYERLIADPEKTLTSLLTHLSGGRRTSWRNLGVAVDLARLEHMKVIEAELGRSLGGKRADNGSHMSDASDASSDVMSMRDEVIVWLERRDVDTRLFEWPSVRTPVAAKQARAA